MSQEWLNIQSFFTDHELLGAINDLNLALATAESIKLRDARYQCAVRRRNLP